MSVFRATNSSIIVLIGVFLVSGILSFLIPVAPGQSAQLQNVTIALPHFGIWDTTLPYLAGKENGFFKDEGLDVSIVKTSGGGETIRTVLSGDAAIGISNGIVGLFGAFKRGADVVIISNEFRSGSVWWFARADSKYNSLQDLNGAKIGFSRPGGSTHMMALRAIEYANLKNVEAVSIGGPPDAFSAVMTGQIDAGWTISPFFLKQLNEGKIKRLFTADQVPPFDNMTVRVNFARGSWLKNNPDTARKLLRAWVRSIEWMYDNVGESVKIWGDAINNDDHELLRQAVWRSFPRYKMSPKPLGDVEKANELAVKFDFIDEPLTQQELDKLIDLSYLP